MTTNKIKNWKPSDERLAERCIAALDGLEQIAKEHGERFNFSLIPQELIRKVHELAQEVDARYASE